ncbi:MAG: tRNA 2-selenouridine(34) synthase MnmH [Ginsengibacter sp.]
MAIEQIDIEEFLRLSEERPVLDVRCPAEYLHAHIPGAVSLPLFTDEQRKVIGTAYKQQSRQVAVKIGLGYFSHRMEGMLSDAEEKIKNGAEKGTEDNRVLVHCWRGGMRSRSVAWLLDLYGYKIYTLKGGYKAFRNWVLDQFEKKYPLKIMGGYTGSGKTRVLQEMKNQGATVIDLERLANHKGSAFGSIGEAPQPGQEMFENLLAIELFRGLLKSGVLTPEKTTEIEDEIWLEDESRHIGSVGIPKTLWNNMRESPLYFLEIPFEERLDYIISTYGTFEKNQLINSIVKIQKRLGGLETRNAINYLLDNNVKECFSILLHYYDKLYTTALYKRENIHDVLNKISCKTVDIRNADKLDQVSC